MLPKSYLEALPAHAMQCFELPLNISRYIDKCNREFFRKKSPTEKGMPMIFGEKSICQNAKEDLDFTKQRQLTKGSDVTSLEIPNWSI